MEIIAQKQELQHAEEAAAALHTCAQLAEARCAVSKHEEQVMQNKLQKMREELERNEAALQAALAVLPDLKTQADTAKVALDAAMQKSVIHGYAGATPEERATMKQVLKQYKKAGFAFQKEESRVDALKSLLAQRKLQMEKLQSEVNKLRAAVKKAVGERDAALAEAASAAAALEEARTAARSDSAARAEESPVLNSLLSEKENELQQLSLVVSEHKGMRQDLTDKSAAARECSSDLHAELLEVYAKLSGLVQRVKENDAKRDLSTQNLFDAVLPLPTGMPAVPTGSDLLSVFRQDSPAADVLAAMKHIVDNDIDFRASLFTRLLANLSKESDPSKPGMKYRIAVICTGPLVSGASRLPGEPSAALHVLNAYEALWPHLRDPALLRAWREARNVGLPGGRAWRSARLSDGKGSAERGAAGRAEDAGQASPAGPGELCQLLLQHRPPGEGGEEQERCCRVVSRSMTDSLLLRAPA